MKRLAVAPSEFHSLTRCLIGLRVSLPWRGYGSALFLEVGRLSKPEGKMKRSGQGCVMIEWSWRVERSRSIAFGSWSGKRKMNLGIASLKGRKIEEILLVGRLPEISIQLSGGLWLHSFMTAEGRPEWSIKVTDGTWISFDAGRIVREVPKKPNKAPEPTPTSVTSPASAGVAPAAVVAHL